MPLGVNGEYMVELWPTPSIVQALPFIAVIQPPNITGDNSNFPAYIRSDIIAKYLIAAALVYRGPKLNKYYDSAESNRLRGEAESELIMMAMADENLYRQNLIYEWERCPWLLTCTVTLMLTTPSIMAWLRLTSAATAGKLQRQRPLLRSSLLDNTNHVTCNHVTRLHRSYYSPSPCECQT